MLKLESQQQSTIQIFQMAAGSEERLRSRFSLGKKLPPVTLSNTPISGLLKLVPVLVAMTSRTSTPRFEEEEDKPPWWPNDVQWKNPKDYCYMADSVLQKLLRKVIHSCYSYHGVEDLLIRLDDSTKMEDDCIDLSDADFDMDGNSSTPDNDGPVFVCCFCLEEFDSHKNVSAHQRVCQDKSQSIVNDPINKMSSLDEKYIDVHDQQFPATSTSKAQKRQPELSDIKSTPPPPHPVSLSVALHCLPNSDQSVQNQKASKQVTAPARAQGKRVTKPTATSSRHQPSSVPSSVMVPTLKTRSQKKLDQIMERHHNKKLMIQECRDLKKVPEAGAWWVHRRKRKRCPPPAFIHPCEKLTKHEFLSGVGLLVKKLKSDPSDDPSSSRKEVDLDCEIISVEGPLSMTSHPFVQDSSNEHNNAVSPRASRSLMSQMSRDESSRSSARRRISSLCFVEDEWADREAINEGRDPRQMCLLTLDLSSPLGQRVKKFAKVDRPMNLVKDVELCCNTEFCDESKLRIRANDFKVTYKKKCRATSWVHKYKFNKSQVREFRRDLRTGLSKRSRYLRRKMQNCRVRLRNLTERDVELYNKEKKVTIAENIAVDDDLCITQIDIPEAGLQHLKNQSLQKPVPSELRHKSNPSPSTSHTSLPSSSHQTPPIRQQCLSHSKSQPSHCQQLRHQHQPSSKGSHFPPRPFSLNPRSSNHSPSPPHIPNIFRNRSNSNTPSPPRHLSRDSKDSHFSFKKALSLLQTTSSHPQNHQCHRHSHHENCQKQRHHLHHHHRHNDHHQNHHRQQQEDSGSCSPPLGFSTGVIISQRMQHKKPSISNTNTNNRRKQPMNHVRHDDSFHEMSPKNSHNSDTDGHTRRSKTPSHPTPSSTSSVPKKTETFINLIDDTPSGPSTSASQLSSHTRQSSQRENTHSKDLSQLSNFEYFSIKQGRITHGHSLPHSNNVNKQHKNSPQNHSSSSSGEVHSNCLPKDGKDLYSELYKALSSPPYSSPSHPPLKHTQNSNSHSQSKPTKDSDRHHHQQHQQPQQPQRQSHHSPSTLNQGSERKSFNCPNHLPEDSLSSVDNGVCVSQQKGRRDFHRPGPKSFQMARSQSRSNHLLPAQKPSPSNLKAGNADDDVMEVICIDD